MNQHAPATAFAATPVAPMPTSSLGKILWAKATIIEAAKVWAGEIKISEPASAGDVLGAIDDCAEVEDLFLQLARVFSDALRGEYEDFAGYIRDGVSDGLAWPLKQWLDEIGHEDGNAEHALSGRQLGVGRHR